MCVCVPRRWLHYTNICSLSQDKGENQRFVTRKVTDKCMRGDAHAFGRNQSSILHNSFSSPMVLTCSVSSNYVDNATVTTTTTTTTDNIGKQLYLSVYGIRHSFYLRVVEELGWGLENVETRQHLLNVMRQSGLSKVIDLKLAIKRPYVGACMGTNIFLKIYHTGECSSSFMRTHLDALSERPLFKNVDLSVLHDDSLERSSKWLCAQKASPVGMLRIEEDIQMNEDRHCFSAAVHHDDINFFESGGHDRLWPNNNNNTNKADRAKRAWFFVHELCLAGVRKTYANGECLMDNDQNNPLDNEVVANILGVAADRAMYKFISDFHKSERWTWRRLKRLFVHTLFSLIKNDPTSLFLGSVVKRDGGFCSDENRKVGGLNLAASIGPTYFALLRLSAVYRTQLKIVWIEHFETSAMRLERESRQHAVMEDVALHSRWMAFDIETDHKPLEVKEEQITLISAVVFDHASGNLLSSHVFFNLPPDRVADRSCIAKTRSRLNAMYETDKLESIASAAKISNVTFHEGEKATLNAFLTAARDWSLTYVLSYNGKGFDIPVIDHRLAVCNAPTLEAREKLVHAVADMKKPPRRMNVPFSHLSDFIRVKYERPSKRVTFRQHGIDTFRNKMAILRAKKHREEGNIDGEDCFWDPIVSESSDDDNDDTDEIVTLRETYMSCLRTARKIKSMEMKHVVLVDLMDFVKSGSRPVKLDTIAKRVLNCGKVDHPAVSYDRLCSSWHGGEFWPEMIVYNLRDSLILVDLVKALRIGPLYRGLAAISGLTEREAFLCEGVRNLVAQTHKFGRDVDLLTPDTTKYRDDRYMWEPDFAFDSASDYHNLRPPAGTTVPGVIGWFPCPSSTLDFNSHYSTVMRGYGYCATTLVPATYAESRKGWKEGTEYERIRLENAAPSLIHTCIEPVRCIENTDKCRFKLKYEHVYHDAYFVQKNVFPSVLYKICVSFADGRLECKAKRDAARARKNDKEADAYEIMQLIYKLGGNTCYGTTMLFTPIVGDAITNQARKQLRLLAKKSKDESDGRGCIVNGDTDSIFRTAFARPEQCANLGAMARFARLDPQATTVPRLVEEMIAEAQRFCNEANSGTERHPRLYKKPCTLGFEKSFFTGLRNYAKKCYAGDKLDAALRWSTHKAGMSGKKADTTTIKSGVQFGADKLLQRRDLRGVMNFFENIIDFVVPIVNDLHSEMAEILRLANDIDENDLLGDLAKERRAEINAIRTRSELCWKKRRLPREWFLSVEKVTCVHKSADVPVLTAGSKQAIAECKIRGEHPDHAASTVKVCRSATVQIGSVMKKCLDMILSAPCGALDAARQDARMRSAIGYKEMVRIGKEAVAKQQRSEREEIEFKKLDITGLPLEYRISPDMRFPLKSSERARLENIRDRVLVIDEAKTKTNRAQRQKQALSSVSIERMVTCIEEFNHTDPFPPTSLFFPDFALTTTKALIRLSACSYRLPEASSSCDLWALYLDAAGDEGVLLSSPIVIVGWSAEGGTASIDFGRDEDTDRAGPPPPPPEVLSPTDWSFAKKNVHRLCGGKRFLLNMKQYAAQTTATPLIVPSYDGKESFLLNSDSYVTCRKNTFRFSLETDIIIHALCELGCDGRSWDAKAVPLRMSAVPHSNHVMLKRANFATTTTVLSATGLAKSSVTFPVIIERSDERVVDRWSTVGTPSAISTDILCSSLDLWRAVHNCMKFEPECHETHVVRFTHDIELDTLTIANDLDSTSNGVVDNDHIRRQQVQYYL